MTQIFPTPVPPSPPDFWQANPPDSPRVLMAMTAAQLVQRYGGGFELNFPVDVFLNFGRLNNGPLGPDVPVDVEVFFRAGVNPFPARLLGNDYTSYEWLEKHGVTIVSLPSA